MSLSLRWHRTHSRQQARWSGRNVSNVVWLECFSPVRRVSQNLLILPLAPSPGSATSRSKFLLFPQEREGD